MSKPDLDIKIEEINNEILEKNRITGFVKERTYKGSTLDSIIELQSGQNIMVSEFFNEDDPDVDHSLGQKVAVDWIKSWEVILDEE